ncbi:MAG: DUF2029 domain-containing protein [Bacteroidia bacterium]|nr:DUF2029 domain-containing protein [Bacteroidia bacterium]
MTFSVSSLIKRQAIFVLYSVLVIAATTQSILIKKKTYKEGGKTYTHYNNYVIFKQSHFHLMDSKDLYQAYPEEHWDFYKYSPTFAFCFGVLANLPDAAGLGLWNAINAFVLLISFFYLQKFSEKSRVLMLAIISLELMTSMQHQESNALITGLIILSFGLMERRKYFLATLFIVLTIYIKLFGVVAIALFIFYPGKSKLALYTMFWAGLLFLLPLIIVSMSQLLFLYSSWLNLILHDHSFSYGYSVMGWIHTWFNLDINKIIILVIGMALFAIPFYRIRSYKEYSFRLFALSSVLLWVVIFNHRAESPSFIIAISGIVIWFYSQEQSKGNNVMMITAFVAISLLSTDLFPRVVRREFLEPYVIKAVPCIVIWIKIIYDMTFNKILRAPLSNSNNI